MATIIPSSDSLRHSKITKGERETAEVLQAKLPDDTKIWYEPLIPPDNEKPDFLILDPGRGMLVVEVKDWKIETIQNADREYATLLVDNEPRTSINPYKQASNYAYSIANKCQSCKALVHPSGHKLEGKIVFPYGIVIVLTNITRNELKSKNLEGIFGNGSVFCKDEFFQNIDDELFREKLWSVLRFCLKDRLIHNQINSFTQVLGIPFKNTPDETYGLPNDEIESSEGKTVEILPPVENNNTPNPTDDIDDNSKNKNNGIFFAAVGLIAVLGLGTYLFNLFGFSSVANNKPNLSVTSEEKKKPQPISNIGNSDLALQTDSITIGVLGSSEYYSGLADYLRDHLGDDIKIILDGDGDTSYQEAKNQIASKNWDVAFALSPMISVAAKDNGYAWLGRMFIKYPPYYQSALFVRSDSPIQSIKDLNSSNSIALGDFNSASSFYMPTYDLFGKTLVVNKGNRGRTIRQMVKEGQVDVGAAAYGDVVTKDPDFRIIHLSRNIPGSGVYLSPKLSSSDRLKLTEVLLDAPVEVKEAANYGEAPEIDYSNFRNIVSRVEEVMTCSDWNKNPVPFYCSEQNAIVARVNGVSRIDRDKVRLKAKGNDSQNYTLIVSPQILNQVPGAGSALNLQNKEIKLIDVTPRKLSNSRLQIDITQPDQIRVIN